IEGYANLLAKRYKGRLDSDAEEFINFILDGTTRMIELIHSVLMHSSIGSSDIKATSNVDMRAVVKEVLVNLKVSIEESGTTVEIGHMPIVVANRTEMVQLLQNLISNAIKYRADKPPL